MLREIAASQAIVEEVLRRPLDDDEADRFRTAVRKANARRLADQGSVDTPQEEKPLCAGGQDLTDEDIDRRGCLMGLTLCSGFTVAIVVAIAMACGWQP